MTNLQTVKGINTGDKSLKECNNAKKIIELEVSVDKLENDRMSHQLGKSYYEYLYSIKSNDVDDYSDFCTAFMFI